MRDELALEDTKSVALMHERPELCSPEGPPDAIWSAENNAGRDR